MTVIIVQNKAESLKICVKWRKSDLNSNIYLLIDTWCSYYISISVKKYSVVTLLKMKNYKIIKTNGFKQINQKIFEQIKQLSL